MRADDFLGAFRTAQTAEASTVHEPVGKPGGPGLWHHKGLQLPPYIQHVANDLRGQGHDESTAVEMAVGIVRNWAEGHDGHGNRVHPDVQAAAAKNVAQWEALKAGSGGARRFNQNHAPAGSSIGGEFASSGGSGSGGKKPAAGKHQAAAHQPGAGGAHRKAALLAQAHADREAARRLEAELKVVEAQLHAAHASATKATAAAKAASAKKATKATVHKASTVTHHKTAATSSASVASLQSKAAHLRTRISELLGQARALDKQAAAIRSATPGWAQAWHIVWHQGSEAASSG